MSPGRRARTRGFASITTVLEATAIAGWFVALVVGERMLSDGVTARRVVEDTAEQSSVMNAASYCEGGGMVPQTLAGLAPTGNTAVAANGTLDLQNLISLVGAVGVGGQATMALYTQPMQSNTTKVGQNGLRGGQAGSQNFYAERSMACQERPKDSPDTSISQYRIPIFVKNILGF